MEWKGPASRASFPLFVNLKKKKEKVASIITPSLHLSGRRVKTTRGYELERKKKRLDKSQKENNIYSYNL